MIRINLLPHREMRRERRKRDFVGVCAFTGIAGVGIALLIGLGINQQISAQVLRNEFIKAENIKLDSEITEIASLRGEIEALKARQEAVENLQSDRTTPVHLLDELVRDTPEGVLLKAIKQDDRRLVITGYAQSNDRISELLRNLSTGGGWLERPELLEIRATTLNAGNPQGPTPQNAARDQRAVFEFGVSVLVRAPESRQPGDRPGRGAAATPGASAQR